MIPDDLKYTAEHEWVRVESGDDGKVATIGITDYAQDALGDIVYVSLPEVGEDLTKGESVGELESTKSVSDIFSPLSGEIVARNDALDGGPEVINSDPYGEGWLIKLRPSEDDPKSGLLEAEAYAALTTD